MRITKLLKNALSESMDVKERVLLMKILGELRKYGIPKLKVAPLDYTQRRDEGPFRKIVLKNFDKLVPQVIEVPIERNKDFRLIFIIIRSESKTSGGESSFYLLPAARVGDKIVSLYDIYSRKDGLSKTMISALQHLEKVATWISLNWVFRKDDKDEQEDAEDNLDIIASLLHLIIKAGSSKTLEEKIDAIRDVIQEKTRGHVNLKATYVTVPGHQGPFLELNQKFTGAFVPILFFKVVNVNNLTLVGLGLDSPRVYYRIRPIKIDISKSAEEVANEILDLYECFIKSFKTLSKKHLENFLREYEVGRALLNIVNVRKKSVDEHFGILLKNKKTNAIIMDFNLFGGNIYLSKILSQSPYAEKNLEDGIKKHPDAGKVLNIKKLTTLMSMNDTINVFLLGKIVPWSLSISRDECKHGKPPLIFSKYASVFLKVVFDALEPLYVNGEIDLVDD